MKALVRKWKKLEEKSLKPTSKYCLICFNKIDTFFIVNRFICDKCLEEMKPNLKVLKIDKYKGIGIYPYQNKVKDLLYKFKGCYDFELKNAFINQYAFIFKLLFFNYIIVCVPSYKQKNLERGFNHVEEMFKCLNLKICNCIIKTKDVKQSSLNRLDRNEIGNYLELLDIAKELENKNVLLVDDVFTTGSTLKSCINLLKTINPKRIKFVVMSYVCR